MRQCGIAFGVIPRSFHDQKERCRLIAPRALTQGCSVQGDWRSIYTMTDDIKKVPTPAMIICDDEDDNCIEPFRDGPALGMKVLTSPSPPG